MRTTTLMLVLAAALAAAPADVIAERCDKNHYILTDLSDCQWTLVGSLNVPRVNHTATLLADGRVLVVGGDERRIPEAEFGGLARRVEIYEPQTRSFRLVAPTHFARHAHAAVPLPDGRVLVVGGDIWEERGSAEIYDPVADAWHVVATRSSLPPRAGPQAMLLPDGRVLVTGSFEEFGTLPPEFLDPVQATWTIAPDAKVKHFWNTATALPGGSILSAGGIDDDWNLNSTQTAIIYDAASGAFLPAASMHGSRSLHSAASLADGRILVTGGHLSDEMIGRYRTLATTETYDPATDTWSVGNDLVERREGHASVALPDGAVLVIGGVSSFGGVPNLTWSVLSSVEMRSPEGEGWRLIGSLNEPRDGHTATRLSDGTILVIGGWNQGTGRLDSAELLGGSSSQQ